MSFSVMALWQEAAPYDAVNFEVTGAVPEVRDSLHVAGWVFCPPAVAVPSTVVLCVPGVGESKVWYHLDVPTDDLEAFSLARALARRGLVVVCLDPLGCGESSTPAGTQLSLDCLASVQALVARQVRERLEAGTLSRALPPLSHLRVIGVGHAQGAWLALTQQARFRSFAALALLDAPLARGEQEHTLVFSRPSRPEYLEVDPSAFHDMPEAVREAAAESTSDVPVALWRDLQQTEHLLAQAATIDVPLFLAQASQAREADVHPSALAFPASHDLTFLELLTGGQSLLLGPVRQLLWRRLALWCQAQGGEEAW